MSKTGTDLVKHLGELAFATRLKRLAELLQSDVGKVYKEMRVDFEPKWFTMLYALYYNEGMSVVELSHLLKLTHPAIIQFAEQMQDKKLISQVKDKHDARRKILSLTEKGRRTFEKIEPVLKEIEAANRDFLRETGSDVLGTVERMERLLEEKSMYRRVNERLSQAFRRETRIVEYQSNLKAYFRSLNEEWLRKYFTVEPVDEKILANPAKEVLAKDGEIFFAQHEEETIGTAAVKRVSSDTFELMKMAVSEPYQSKGVGKLLVQRAIDYAKQQKANYLELDTSRKLEKAMRLYEGFGFKLVEDEPSADYSRSTIKMRLDLNTVFIGLLFSSMLSMLLYYCLKQVTQQTLDYTTAPWHYVLPGGDLINSLIDTVLKLVL